MLSSVNNAASALAVSEVLLSTDTLEQISDLELPPGKLPRGQIPEGSLPEGEVPQDHLSPSSEELDPSKILEKRSRKRRGLLVEKALQNNLSLSSTVQNQFLQSYLSEGWGRFAHGVARQLKSPTRYGLKLVDVALIMTVYDRTVALVNPVMFAPISAPDFIDDTGMDESNIRAALKSLEQKGVLLKIKTGTINFWALNPHYFSSKQGKERGHLPLGNLPRGNQQEGNAPCVKQGKLPGVQGGQTTQGSSYQTSGNQKGISVVKNLFKESKKESSLSTIDFPKDMLERWSRFQKAGLEKKIEEEKLIFESLLIQFGKSFFDQCGSVVAFLEGQGSGKKGPEGKIYSPMVWIQDHWETNLARYLSWKAKQEELSQAHAKKLEQESKEKIRLAEQEKARNIEAQEETAWNEKMNAASERFLAAYQTEERIGAFVTEAIEKLGCIYTKSSWKKYGWDHPTARACVLEHFLKVESGECVSSVRLN